MGSRVRHQPARTGVLAAVFLSPGFAKTVATVHVDATPGHAINSLDPDQAIGSSIDKLNKNVIDKVYSVVKSD